MSASEDTAAAREAAVIREGAPQETVAYTLRDLLLYFLYLGTFGFGGPTVAIFLATLLVLAKLRKAPEPLVIVAAGVVGIAVRGLVR